MTVVHPEHFRVFSGDGRVVVRPGVGSGIELKADQLKFTQPALPIPPVIQVIRADAEKKIDELSAEVKELRGQLDKLLEQVESLKVSPPKAANKQVETRGIGDTSGHHAGSLRDGHSLAHDHRNGRARHFRSKLNSLSPSAVTSAVKPDVAGSE